MPIRGNMQQLKHNNPPMPRSMAGSAPSPQTSIGNSYQPRAQWSQPSPGNQQMGGHFAQPKPRPPTSTQVSSNYCHILKFLGL